MIIKLDCVADLDMFINEHSAEVKAHYNKLPKTETGKLQAVEYVLEKNKYAIDETKEDALDVAVSLFGYSDWQYYLINEIFNDNIL